MTQLIFVRHAQTMNNVNFVLSSAHPGPALTELGREQALQVASLLAGVQVDAIFSSPLRRAVETATAIAASISAPMVTRDGLRECGVGTLEGRSDDAAFARYHEAWELWLQGDGLDVELGPQGETGEQALSRMHEVIEEVGASYPDGTVVLVSHGGLLQLSVAALAGNLPQSWAAARPIPNAGVIEAEVNAGVMRCTRWCGETPPRVQESLEEQGAVISGTLVAAGADALMAD